MLNLNATIPIRHATRLASTAAQTSLRLLVPLDPKPRTAVVVLYILAVLQMGHFIEHLVQVAQVHLLHWPEAQARGIASWLDEEPVHFVFNLGVFVTVVGLFRVMESNRWLWVCLPLTGWHALEHSFRLWAYLHDEGLAGLLGHGGLLFGGLPIGERALHFGYNLAELTLLVAALLTEVRSEHNTRYARGVAELRSNRLPLLSGCARLDYPETVGGARS